MWPDRRIIELFKTEFPIVLAPMAGVMDAELVIAAAQGGALGSLPCAMLSAEKAREQVNVIRQRVHTRIREKMSGTAERPRLNVYRSLNHIYTQLIDDLNGVTLAAASSSGKKAGVKHGANVQAATEVGKKLAEFAKSKGIDKAAFDRGHYKFHGRVKALAEAANAAGLLCCEPKPRKKAKLAAMAAAAPAKAAKAEKAAAAPKEKKEKKEKKEPQPKAE